VGGRAWPARVGKLRHGSTQRHDRVSQALHRLVYQQLWRFDVGLDTVVQGCGGGHQGRWTQLGTPPRFVLQRVDNGEGTGNLVDARGGQASWAMRRTYNEHTTHMHTHGRLTPCNDLRRQPPHKQVATQTKDITPPQM